MKLALSPITNGRSSLGTCESSFFEHSTVTPMLPPESVFPSQLETSQSKKEGGVSLRKRRSGGEPLGIFDLFELRERIPTAQRPVTSPSGPQLNKTASQKNNGFPIHNDDSNRMTECFPLRARLEGVSVDVSVDFPKKDGKQSLSQAHVHTVWTAAYRTTGKIFAVKFLWAPSREQREAQQRRIMRSEVEIHRKMKHPYIARLCGFLKNIPITEDREKKACALVVEFVPHGSLNDQLEARKSSEENHFREIETRNIIAQLCSALRYMHNSHHAVHCDVKLANVLYDTDRKQIKLIDFGFAVDLQNAKKNTAHGTDSAFTEKQLLRRGTLNYLAPEQIDGSVVYGTLSKIDIWALGVCTFELLTGASPFARDSEVGTRQAIRKGSISQTADAISTLSDDAKSFLSACFQTDPRRRPSTDMLMKHQWLNVRSCGGTPKKLFR